MSFRCSACNKSQAPRAKPGLVTVEFRPVFNRDEVQRGHQIARQVNLCEDCATEIKPASDRVLARDLPEDELAIVREALQAIGRKQPEV